MSGSEAGTDVGLTGKREITSGCDDSGTLDDHGTVMQRSVVVEDRYDKCARDVGVHLGSAVDDVLEGKLSREDDQSSALGLNKSLAGVEDGLDLVGRCLHSADAEESVASEARSEGSLEVRLIQDAEENDKRNDADSEKILKNRKTGKLADQEDCRIDQKVPDHLRGPVLGKGYVEIVEEDRKQRDLHDRTDPINRGYRHSNLRLELVIANYIPISFREEVLRYRPILLFSPYRVRRLQCSSCLSRRAISQAFLPDPCPRASWTEAVCAV